MITKAEIARRQLGTALDLFLHDRDPVSVHALACAGAEIAEALLAAAGATRMRQLALASYPEMTERDYTELRNRYWNAFKHANDRRGKERDDRELLAAFNDGENEIRLFTGWVDYGNAVGQLPVSAQVFTAWFLALDLTNFVGEEPRAFAAKLEKEFPGLAALPRDRRKQRLRRAVQKYSRDRNLLASPNTDLRPLVLSDW